MEDVTTSCGSAIESAKKAIDFGLDVVGISCLVDREAGAADSVAKFSESIGRQIMYWPIFTLTQIQELRNATKVAT